MDKDQPSTEAARPFTKGPMMEGIPVKWSNGSLQGVEVIRCCTCQDRTHSVREDGATRKPAGCGSDRFKEVVEGCCTLQDQKYSRVLHMSGPEVLKGVAHVRTGSKSVREERTRHKRYRQRLERRIEGGGAAYGERESILCKWWREGRCCLNVLCDVISVVAEFMVGPSEKGDVV
jgi:hypothetical protein